MQQARTLEKLVRLEDIGDDEGISGLERCKVRTTAFIPRWNGTNSASLVIGRFLLSPRNTWQLKGTHFSLATGWCTHNESRIRCI